jgi:hypothetical protein
VHTSITNLTQQLQSLEALELNNITQRQQQEFRKPRPRPPNRPTIVRPRMPYNHPNLITQSKKYKPIKCWGCGQGHNLRDCPTTSDQQKQAIYQQKREEIANRKPNLLYQAQEVKTQSRTLTSIKPTLPPQTRNTTAAAVTTTDSTTMSPVVTNMSRRSGMTYAATATHHAKMAKKIHRVSTKKAFSTNESSPKEPYSLIGDWLIDSGCTTHMTPHV